MVEGKAYDWKDVYEWRLRRWRRELGTDGKVFGGGMSSRSLSLSLSVYISICILSKAGKRRGTGGYSKGNYKSFKGEM